MDDTEPDAPNLANDMYQSPAFRGAVQDDDFAWALCKLLVNSDFIQESSNRFWSSDGNAHSGEIIELLRGQRGGFRVYEDAEWYADTPEIAYQNVRAALQEIGWRLATREDYDAWQTEWNGYFAELLQALEKFGHRSSAPTPAWAEGLNAELKHAKFIVDFRGRDERFIARVRLIELALAGQVTEEEFGAAKLILNV